MLVYERVPPWLRKLHMVDCGWLSYYPLVNCTDYTIIWDIRKLFHVIPHVLHTFFSRGALFHRGALSSSICVINFRFRCSKSACITTIPARIWVTSASPGHGKHGKRDDGKRNHGLDAMVAWCCSPRNLIMWLYDHDMIIMIQLKNVSKQWEKHPTSPNTRVRYWKRAMKQGAMKQSLNVAHHCMNMPNMQL